MICRSLEFNLWMHMSCNPCLGSVIWMMRKLDALPECWFGMDVKAKRGRKRMRVAIMVSRSHEIAPSVRSIDLSTDPFERQ